MNLSILLQQMGVILILVSIGFALYRKKVIDDNTSKKLSAIVVDVCNPALIMASLLSGGITAGHSDLITAVCMGAAFYLVLILLGFILPLILRTKGSEKRFYNLMTVYTNTGFLGIPLARAILPPNAILYVIVINVFYSLLFYTHGLTVLGPGKSGHKKNNPLLNIINPGTVMAILSLAVFWYDITLPPILSNTIQYVGNATVFLSMTLLGVSIARSRLADSLRDLRIWGYILLRMLLVPVLFVLAMRAAGFEDTAVLAICLMAAVPVGNLPMIQAEKIGEDTRTLSSAIAVTTAVSLLTITLL
ncbi:MAG: AEC family transporter, partial [Lachnospiraceae bacterium]|nr:AEC family transporter [Lachnospiraceae bacterium]